MLIGVIVDDCTGVSGLPDTLAHYGRAALAITPEFAPGTPALASCAGHA